MTTRIEADSNDAEAYRIRGVYLDELRQYEAAMADYNKAIELEPDYADAYNKRGIANNVLKQYEAAITDCDKAIELKPDFAEAYRNRGIAHHHLKQYEAAFDDYDKAIELKPDYADAYNGRGITHKAQKQYEAAFDDYDKAIELKANNVTAYINRGITHIAQKQYEAAFDDYDKAIELKPDFANAYCYRGNARVGLKQYEAAFADYDKAIELKPGFADAFYNRGIAHSGLKQYKAAIADFDKAIELDPINPSYIHNRAVAMAFQESEKEREEMSARLEEGFDTKLSEALEEQSDEFAAQAGQLLGNLKDNIDTLGREKRRHGRNTLGLSILQALIFLFWLAGLYCYFTENVLDTVGFRHPMAVLPYISIALVISTPVIWGLKILGQNILEAKSLKQDALRRLFIENNLRRIPTSNSAEREIRQKMLAGYFTSWQNNSPVEILLQLNSRRIGPETFLDRILPIGSKPNYTKLADKQALASPPIKPPTSDGVS